MSDFLFTFAAGMFFGLAIGVLYPDISVIPAGMLRKAWEAIKRWSSKE